ncbi:MAG TPA: DUF58 domain-containing protein [Sphingomonas sp.]|jgi:uncharacterized protein (DUF58 family)|nr:DUF58 domain-containing protein [Sphingomonas sp.]
MTRDLLPAGVRARLKGLMLSSRRAIGDHGLGLHASRSRGAGLEFAQYRAYERGDELRQVDWKLYARSDRFFVREAERESPLCLWILVDASASMAQADGVRADWSRLDAAKALAMALVELAMAGGDRFALLTLSDTGLGMVPPGNGTRQRDRIRLALHDLAPGGGFPADGGLASIWERVGTRDLVVLLGDCFDPECADALVKLSAAGREVLTIQLLTVEERDFPFDGGHRFRDPETGEELLADAPALRADFVARFSAARAALHGQLEGGGVRHVEYILDEPLDSPLRALFG